MITETEQAYIARIREYFGNELVSVDTHPGDWSDSVLRTMLINAPAIYVAWLGAGEGRTRGRLVSHWVFYVIGDMLNGREASRPGLYQIVARLIAVLNGFRTEKPHRFTLKRRSTVTPKPGGQWCGDVCALFLLRGNDRTADRYQLAGRLPASLRNLCGAARYAAV